jgi:hypothetical protein
MNTGKAHLKDECTHEGVTKNMKIGHQEKR